LSIVGVWQHRPVSLHADLVSMQSSLDQLLERVLESVSEVQGTDRDDLVGDLYEVERNLRAAARRLSRAASSLPGG
jgi:hypothetical protein